MRPLYQPLTPTNTAKKVLALESCSVSCLTREREARNYGLNLELRRKEGSTRQAGTRFGDSRDSQHTPFIILSGTSELSVN